MATELIQDEKPKDALARLREKFHAPPSQELKRGRPPIGAVAKEERVRSKERRAIESASRKKNIAILDFETDPFDNKKQTKVRPFLAVLYSDEFDTVIIWDENFKRFIEKVYAAIAALPEKFTIYAHNGGKFDYMFLVSKLRGNVMFKGRGIMSATIAGHELRDSFHIIPERLANWKKDEFDYTNLEKGKRASHRDAIIKYCINDCKYLLEIVKHMVGEYGLKISIGQMAQYELRKTYKVGKLTSNSDAYLRHYFFGGRVECLQGMGHWTMPKKLYDVNSMYPKAMADYSHPVGSSFDIRHGKPGPQTVFLDLTCTNHGALVRKDDAGATTANVPNGRFQTTIWEYETALKYGLIEDVQIKYCIDFEKRSNFAEFVNPLYEKRILTKERMKLLEKGSTEHNDAKKDDMLLKYILNNAYGKFAQNPRRYKETYLSDPGEVPPDEWFPIVDGYSQRCLPVYECDEYHIWEKPNPGLRFNNVATAASITGAARAILMEAIELAVDPIYCDTDSLICTELPGVELHPTKLGAWDLELELDEIIITGKKQYACKVKGYPDGHKDRLKIRSKGVSGFTWNDFVKLLDGETIKWISPGPTMTRRGDHFYMRRDIRATATRKPNLINRRIA